MSKNGSIYKPPSSDLKTEEIIPLSYVNGPLSSKKLRFLGWISVFSALLSIPIIGITFINGLESANELYPKTTRILEISSTIIWVYLLLSFKVFINYRFEVTSVNRHLNMIILLTVLMTICSILYGNDGGGSKEFDIHDTETISMLFLFVLLGIVTILFGKRLLAITSNFHYLRLFSLVNIAMGICLISIILLLLIVPLGIAYDILLALISFTASRELEMAQNA